MPAATIPLREYFRQMTNPRPGDVTDDWNEAHVLAIGGWRELWDVASVAVDGRLACTVEPGETRILSLDAQVRGQP